MSNWSRGAPSSPRRAVNKQQQQHQPGREVAAAVAAVAAPTTPTPTTTTTTTTTTAPHLLLLPPSSPTQRRSPSSSWHTPSSPRFKDKSTTRPHQPKSPPATTTTTANRSLSNRFLFSLTPPFKHDNSGSSSSSSPSPTPPRRGNASLEPRPHIARISPTTPVIMSGSTAPRPAVRRKVRHVSAAASTHPYLTRVTQVTGQMSLSSTPTPSTSSLASMSASTSTASTQPRLKARVNPASIASSPAGSGASTPGFRPTRAPSTTTPSSSIGLRTESTPSSRARSPVGGAGTPRSVLGGAGTAARGAAVGGAKPLVAKAQIPASHVTTTPGLPTASSSLSSASGLSRRLSHSATGSGAASPGPAAGAITKVRSPSIVSGSSTPGPTTPASSVLSGMSASSAQTSSSTPKAKPSGGAPTHEAAAAAATARAAHMRPSPTTPTPASVSTPTPSTAVLSTSPEDSLGFRAAHVAHVSSRPQVSPLAHQVTPASTNMTAVSPLPVITALQTQQMSTSLLSPSTLIPERKPSPPPLFGGGLEAPVPRAPFGTASLVEPEPSSNHSSPVRPTRPLDAVSPLHVAFQHVFQHPAASCPTSPNPSSGLALNGSADTGSIADRPPRKHHHPLPWNPYAPPPPLPLPPTSPELRTVALPLMTPTRSIESVEGTPLRGPGAWTSRRLSSSSEGGYSPVRHKLDLPRMGRDRLSGSTIADADADADGDVEDHDEELKLKAVVSADGFSDAEKAKVERKVG